MKNIIKNNWAFLLLSCGLVGFIASCGENKFKVKGEIYGAEDKSIVLEKSDFHGFWQAVDSVKTNHNGGFSLAFPAPAAPEIYRLALNGQYIYFPVDSTETITVTSSFDKFGHDFEILGSGNAEKMANFEKELQKVSSAHPDSLGDFKKNVFTKYMKDAPGSIVNFYILTKTIDGNPLYDPENSEDLKYFGAVATGYKTVRPEDPHTLLLEQTALKGLKKKNGEKGNYKTIEAREISLIEIELPDENGKIRKLSEIVGKGKPVVVIFSVLNYEESPELNIALANIYKRLGGNVEFFNVSLDADQYAWREAAKNLPWITVYSPGEENSADARRYNAFQLPSFYIYNGQGDLTSRPMTLDELNKSL